MLRNLGIGETANKLENYYDENVDYHLSPIKKLFFSALFIGILAALAAMLPFYRWGYNTFVLIYTIYYIYVAVAVMYYCFDGDFFLAPAETSQLVNWLQVGDMRNLIY